MTSMSQWFKSRGQRRRQRAPDVGSQTLTPPSVATTVTPEAKGAFPLIALQTNGAATWSPRGYRSFAREGVMQNPVVFRCIRLIAEAAASVPLVCRADGSHGAKVDVACNAAPLLNLLRHPAPGQTGADFFEAWYGYLLVSGNAYAQAVTDADGVRSLALLRPDRVSVITDDEGWADGVAYTNGSRTTRLTGDALPGIPHVLHLKMFHPENDHYGLSPIEAAAAAIDIHNGASRWNKALLDNAARPSGALVYTAGEAMTADQFDRLKSELEANFQGARNAGRPLLLEGGLDWKAMSLSPRDMDFIAAKHAAARDIALALGVPPMLLGIPGDNTYANYQEANRTFWRQTVLPLVKRTALGFATWLGPLSDVPLTLAPNVDAIDALSGERDALWQRLEAASFLDENEKRAAIGYPPRGRS